MSTPTSLSRLSLQSPSSPSPSPSKPSASPSVVTSTLATQDGAVAGPNICHTCGEIITTSQFIRVGAYKFHKDHFTCVACCTSLHGKKFHHKESKFYCANDYVEKFCHTCRHCVRADTLITYADGTTRPIQHVCVGDKIMVHTVDEHGVLGGLTTDIVVDVVDQGMKPCVRLDFSGAVLECTGDHLLLAHDGTWRHAAKFNIGDRVQMGSTAPNAPFVPSNWQLNVDSILLKCDSVDEWRKSLAFFRLAGLFCSSILQSSSQSFFSFTHAHDAFSVNRDIRMVLGELNGGKVYEVSTHSAFCVELPSALSQVLSQLLSCNTSILALLVDASLPHSMIREFLAALMGTVCGSAPQFDYTLQSIVSPNFHTTCTRAQLAQVAAHCQLLRTLFQAVDIQTSEVHTYNSDVDSIHLSFTILNLIQFHDSVGIRYNSLQSLRYSSAAAASRYQHIITSTPSHSHSHFDLEQWCRDANILSILNTTTKTPLVHSFELDQTLLIEEQPVSEIPLGIDHDQQQQQLLSSLISTSTPFTPSSSQLSSFTSTSLSSLLPTYHLPLTSSSPSGTHAVYDLEMRTHPSFIAASLCVHNCKQKIATGSVIQAFGGYYHPEHFVCSTCSKPFKNGKYYENEELPYCEEHFFMITAEKCESCGQGVKETEMVRVQGKVYHNHCLQCFHCGLPLAKKGSIFQKDSKVYCRIDYLNFFCKRCTSCGDHILKHCISVNDEFYHPDCLMCSTCHKKLDKYICISGHLRCQDHTDSPCAPFNCSVCTKIIEGEVILAVGKKTHPDCFKCGFCSATLQKASCKLKDDKLCCNDCIMKKDANTMANNAREGAKAEAKLEALAAQDAGKSNSFADFDDPTSFMTTTNLDPTSPKKPVIAKPHNRKVSKSVPAAKIEWKKGELIGKGSFGKVYMAMDSSTGELIAVKQVRLNTAEEQEQAASIQNEIGLMENLRHPNIVTLLGIQRSGNKLNILMEYVPGKSLDSLLEGFGGFAEKVIRSYTKQLLEALKYCHSSGVVHRDIKGKNILIDTKGNLKLADFGSAKRFTNVMSKDAPSLSYNYTPLWTAPEVLVGDYNSKVDIWSLGCVIIEMASAKPPWSEQNFENPFRALYHIGNSDAIPKIPDSISELGRNFVMQCLRRDPDQRPDAATLLKHEWLKGIENTTDQNSSGDESDD